MSQSQLYEWVEQFRNGVTCLEDAPRPGRPASVVNPDMVEAVEDLNRGNQHVTINEVAAARKMSHGSAYEIIMSWATGMWVPRFLTPEMKENRVVACQTLLYRYEYEGEAFLDMIVTTDESWVHHYAPANMEWPHTESPRPRKVCVQSSTGKVMLAVLGQEGGNC